MSLRDDLLPVLDEVRAIPGELGLRPFEVWMRVTTWDGGRVGVGTKTTTDTQFLVGGQNPKCHVLTSKDVVASGGLYSEADVRVGPLTPQFPGGGSDTTAFDPPVTGAATQVAFRILGPGITAGGDWYRKIGQNDVAPLRYEIILRKTGQVP